MMGHSSITVTERYAHLADDALRGAVLGTPCLDNLQVRERVYGYGRVMLRAVGESPLTEAGKHARIGPQEKAWNWATPLGQGRHAFRRSATAIPASRITVSAGRDPQTTSRARFRLVAGDARA